MLSHKSHLIILGGEVIHETYKVISLLFVAFNVAAHVKRHIERQEYEIQVFVIAYKYPICVSMSLLLFDHIITAEQGSGAVYG